MKVRKIDYTVGAGIAHSKRYHHGGQKRYGKTEQQGDYKAVQRGTHISEEELSEVREEGGVIKTEGTRIGESIARKIRKK